MCISGFVDFKTVRGIIVLFAGIVKGAGETRRYTFLLISFSGVGFVTEPLGMGCSISVENLLGGYRNENRQ